MSSNYQIHYMSYKIIKLSLNLNRSSQHIQDELMKILNNKSANILSLSQSFIHETKN